MNILPKKRWHVRTKDNIARVRRDEAKALEEQKDQEERIKLAEREARREFLLNKNRSSKGFISLDTKKSEEPELNKHINFFEELEEGTAEQKNINKEHEKEKKEEKEKYEKQIGYLTYLGQDTNEALGKKSWYDVVPDRSEVKNEINLKSKIREDPLNIMKKYTKNTDKKNVELSTATRAINSREENLISCNIRETKTHKHKKHKKNKKRKRRSSSESTDDNDGEKQEKQRHLEMLRLKRLKRETEERLRTDQLLAKLNPKEDKGKPEDKPKQVNFKAKYNSQFNPYLAKQNYT